MATDMGADSARLMRFVLEMRQAGITDPRALGALEVTPRTYFTPAHLQGLALDDVGLPLAHGQTMTKPSLVGRVVEALSLLPEHSVLEVGTGSGYQAAVIASLADKVFTLDRWRDLVADARVRFGTARLMRVFAHTADGRAGWAEEAPYDRIVVNAAVEEFPIALLDQLKPDGIIIAPLGDAAGQQLIRYRNGARENLGAVKFAAMEQGVGEDAPPAAAGG